MLKFQRFLSITLIILFTVVAGSARAGRDGPGGTGGGDLANSDLLDFSENAELAEISPENIRGYHEAAEPALKRLEFFIPGFAQDLNKAIHSKKWLIDPRGLTKPQDDQNTVSGVSFEGRMAYQNEQEIRINGKLLKLKRIPDAIWGKLIIHEGVRALSLKLASHSNSHLTEEQIHQIVRRIYSPRIDVLALYEQVSFLRSASFDSRLYVTRLDLIKIAKDAQEVDERFCSGGESAWRAYHFNLLETLHSDEYIPMISALKFLHYNLSHTEYLTNGYSEDSAFLGFMTSWGRSVSYLPDLPASKMDRFVKDAHEFCTRNRARIDRLSHLSDDETTISSLDQVIQKIIAQKINKPKMKLKPVLRTKKSR